MLTRLVQALDMGAAPIPATGRLALVDPPAGPVPGGISDLTPDRTDVVTPYATVRAVWEAAGYTTRTDPSGPYAAAVVCISRVRIATHLRVAQTAAELMPGAPLMVDGQKTDGVEPLLRDCRERVEITDSYVKRHGRLFWFPATDALDEWMAPARDWPVVDGFHTAPGVFSADGIDPGSELLAGALPADLKGTVVDLGAGWGYLAAQVLARPGVTALHLVEDDARALDAARINVTDPRAAFHWADALAWQPPQPVDLVVSNPPFHTGRAADPELGRAFIAAAARMLSRHGVLWMVANRHLPYEAALEAAFHTVRLGPAGQGYKVIVAEGPRAAAEARRRP